MLAQRGDRRHCLTLGAAAQKILKAAIEDCPSLVRHRLARGPALEGDPFEVVEAEQKGLVQPLHRRLDIARHSAIDDEDRLPPAAFQRAFDHFRSYCVLARAQRDHDDVAFGKRRGESIVRHKMAVEPPRRGLGACACRRARHQPPQPAGAQLLHDNLTHLAVADKNRRGVREIAVDVAGDLDGGGSHRYRPLADRRLLAHLLGDAVGRLQRRFELGPDHAGSLG